MLVFGAKMGFGGLICRVWVKQARKKRSKTFENVQKRSKTFKNIQKHSNFEWKRSKIFNELMVTGKWLNDDWGGEKIKD